MSIFFGVVKAGQYPRQLSATVAYSHAITAQKLASISFQHLEFYILLLPLLLLLLLPTCSFAKKKKNFSGAKEVKKCLVSTFAVSLWYSRFGVALRTFAPLWQLFKFGVGLYYFFSLFVVG